MKIMHSISSLFKAPSLRSSPLENFSELILNMRAAESALNNLLICLALVFALCIFPLPPYVYHRCPQKSHCCLPYMRQPTLRGREAASAKSMKASHQLPQIEPSINFPKAQFSACALSRTQVWSNQEKLKSHFLGEWLSQAARAQAKCRLNISKRRLGNSPR